MTTEHSSSNAAARYRKVKIIDTHTGGEPTRIVLDGHPVNRGSMEERRSKMRSHYDSFRSAMVNEPRGSDVLVGALWCKSELPDCVAGTVFFNNVGYLNMCGHGMIGLVAAMDYAGELPPGEHKFETPVGVVSALLHGDGQVTINNVAAHRSA